jgi:hypothetical protein
VNARHGWYFTAPWDPISVRPRDALGLGAGANYFGNLLAPGLSNATVDARWITLLSWCLKGSHIAWRNAGGRELSRPEEQRTRYAWLRPLELLWIARTFQTDKQVTGQLRGQRAVKHWLDDGQRLDNFGMSPDQFRRYRQTGTYGAYRVVFRTIRGLTTGDGWTPGDTALKLARLVNDSLPRAARLAQEHLESKSRTRWANWRGGQEVRYWMTRGWSSWQTVGGYLPTPADAVRKPLPDEERWLLEETIFDDDSNRRVTAKVLAAAKGSASHADLCNVLASSSVLSRKIEPASLAPLPAFSRLADAGMNAMQQLWMEINHDQTRQAPAIAKLAQSTQLQTRLNELRENAADWLNLPSRKRFPWKYEYVATHLAETMRDAATTTGQIWALAKHHQQHGGGRRWFREQGGKLVTLIHDTGIGASHYGFRLRALCRLAAQCGVANMDRALDVLDSVRRQETDDGEDDTP